MVSARVASLVSSQWLRQQLSSKPHNLRLLDTTWGLTKSGHEAFQTEHIPGSLFFDINRCVNPLSLLPRNLPEASCFTEYVRTLGLNHDNHLVVYDRGIMLAASRMWWNLKAYGYEHVSVLDGGLTTWKSEGFPVDTGPMSLPDKVGDFEVTLRKEYLQDYAGIFELARQGTHQIVDARSPKHFRGECPEPTGPSKKAFEGLHLAVPNRPMLAGHIPGSINLPEDDLINKETKRLLPSEKLKEVFQTAGVDLSRPLTTLCYNGNAACLVALAATQCGQNDISIYYGSWTEYGLKASAEQVESGWSFPVQTE